MPETATQLALLSRRMGGIKPPFASMSHPNQSRETSFGYLSTVHTGEHGYFGGYLIVCPLGRPLEFHCTPPVQPSRALEILYGPTLQPYLIGEQIGGALLQAATLTPRLVLTDHEALLAVRAQAGAPIARLLAGAGSGDHASRGTHELQLPPGYESERSAVLESIALAAQHIDLAEPFGRIHEAIREAQRIGGRPLEGHGQAA